MADFDLISEYYDIIYIDTKGYEDEAKKIIELEKKYNRSPNKHLLDIGCGTGEQMKNLSSVYEVAGLDYSEGMINKAKEKVPDANYYIENMFDFVLEQKYGIAINLFGSIGFAKDYQEMVRGLKSVYGCLEYGGILILTPWDTTETYNDKTLVDCGEKDGIKFCYMESVKQSNCKIEVEMFHLLGKNNKIKEYHYTQNVTLFSEKEYVNAIREAGFEICTRLSENDFRMGAFVCRKSLMSPKSQRQ